MKKRLFSLIMLLPFIANGTDSTPSSRVVLKSILTLKKIGIHSSLILDDLSNDSKIDLLRTASLEIQKSDDVNVLDLRSLEFELKASIHHTDD